MCWKRTAGEIINLYAEYLGGDRTAAVEKLQEHTHSKNEEVLKERLNKRQRALLVARTFAKEVTTTALWLQEQYGVDVSCLQLTPYLDEETGECYIDRTDLIRECDPGDLLTGLRLTERELEEQAAALDRLETQGRRITEFSKLVAKKATARLEPELRPTEADKMAQGWRHFWCFGLWRPESPGFTSYIFVSAPKDDPDRFRVTLLLQMWETAVLKAGVSKSTVEKLRGLIATFAEKPGWNARPIVGFPETGKTVHVALDEAGAEVAAETLAEVIREMYPRIKRVLDKDAV